MRLQPPPDSARRGLPRIGGPTTEVRRHLLGLAPLAVRAQMEKIPATPGPSQRSGIMRIATLSQEVDGSAGSVPLHQGGVPPTHSTTVTCTYPLVQQHWDGKLLLSACTRSR